ncbi:MAG: LTA synthase family protein [Clostridiales Family XIII bacterium]|jgi:phosphoglycerol transferase MdoB-like AlkP superfamily enzyme|nr:LTA synthase family protein [Clostridiales Family XIII bacterium]
MGILVKRFFRFVRGYAARHRIYLIASAACLLAGAPALHLLLQAQIGMPAFRAAHPLLFVYGTWVLLLILIAAAGVCGNAFLGTSVVAACICLLGFADRTKYAVRMEHVFPDDLVWFFRADQLAGMYDASDLPQTFLLMAALLAPGIVVTVILHRRAKRLRAGRAAARIIPRLAAVAVGVGLIIVVTAPIRSAYLGSISAIDYEYIAWNQSWNFERNGYIAAFISNLKHAGMEEPEGYDEEAIAAIVSKYKAKAEEENAARIDLAAEDVDVVFVMNESFSDPDRFKDVYPFTGPVMQLVPNLHLVESKAAYGHCYSPRYGGGTANIEFEALTGFSTYFLGWAYPFQSMLPDMDSFPSVGATLSDAGYTAVGLHAYGATMYRRNTVYPLMGYDEFHGVDEFAHTAHEGGSQYVSDRSSYAEVEDYLERGAQDGDRNVFVTLVTMENHPQYGSQYDEHEFLSQVEDATYQERLKIADYMSLIHSSDAALGEFLRWVDAREKRTVVVFWGDHLPGVYDGLFKVSEDLAYETPFFIYSNFKQEKESLGSVSPNYITPMFFDWLGARMTPWDYLLDEVRDDVPVLTAPYWSEDPPPETEAYLDYRLIQYDVMEGEGWSRELGLFNLGDV